MEQGMRTGRARRLLALAGALALGACASGEPDAVAPVPTVSLAPAEVPAAREVMGMAPARLRTTFGEPTVLRVEGEAQMWQYQTGGCVLFLFLYPGAEGRHEVTHLEYEPQSGSRPLSPEAGMAACLEAAVRARRPSAPVS
ncbi:MAG: hypothetical protein HXY25_10505 [Alphaproteobacteria bacterium]|nr:hypothetical protein [Alphaproteobacteria bacterium]